MRRALTVCFYGGLLAVSFLAGRIFAPFLVDAIGSKAAGYVILGLVAALVFGESRQAANKNYREYLSRVKLPVAQFKKIAGWLERKIGLIDRLHIFTLVLKAIAAITAIPLLWERLPALATTIVAVGISCFLVSAVILVRLYMEQVQSQKLLTSLRVIELDQSERDDFKKRHDKAEPHDFNDDPVKDSLNGFERRAVSF